MVNIFSKSKVFSLEVLTSKISITRYYRDNIETYGVITSIILIINILLNNDLIKKRLLLVILYFFMSMYTKLVFEIIFQYFTRNMFSLKNFV